MARTPINHEEKKAQIAQAALTTFATYGFEGTTNKLIAQEVGKLPGPTDKGKGVSPALIYHYFPEGKTQLFAACFQQFPPIQNFAQVIQANLELPVEDFLRLIAHSYNRVLRSDKHVLPIIRLVIAEGPHHPELISTVLSHLWGGLIEPLAIYFEKHSPSGKLSASRPDQSVLLLFAPIFLRRVILGTFPEGKLPFTPSQDEEFIESLVQSLLKGLFEQ